MMGIFKIKEQKKFSNKIFNIKEINTMKKFGLLLLTGALTLGLAACGGAEEEATTKEVSEETSAGQDEAVEATGDVQEFTISASNWDFSSDKELVVKKGTAVKINLVNEEGMHTIGNEDLGINLTADAPAEFTADKTGEYELICSTICGAMEDHDAMKITLKIVD
jgi:cytochrome c oxidase subunit II